jgi:hypothetical protein
MSFIGYLDGFNSGCITGWALNEMSPDDPVELSVQMNGQHCQSVLAIHHRLDVQRTFGNRGCNGFRFNLPAGLTPRGTVEIAVRLPDGCHIEKSPLALTDMQLINPNPRSGRASPVSFMHIQRTAGTSLRDAVLSNYDPADVLLVYPDPPGIPQRAVPGLPLFYRQAIRCVYGHFLMGVHEHIPGTGPHVTFLRNPITRIVSQYHHMIANRSPHVFSGGSTISLDELLEARTSSEMDNLMVRFFSGSDEEVILPGEIGEVEYRIAVENFDRHFCFIGHQEYLDRDWEQCCKIFGWPPSVVGRRNTGNYGEFSIRDDTRQRILKFNPYDMALYEHITKRFPLSGVPRWRKLWFFGERQWAARLRKRYSPQKGRVNAAKSRWKPRTGASN